MSTTTAGKMNNLTLGFIVILTSPSSTKYMQSALSPWQNKQSHLSTSSFHLCKVMLHYYSVIHVI